MTLSAICIGIIIGVVSMLWYRPIQSTEMVGRQHMSVTPRLDPTPGPTIYDISQPINPCSTYEMVYTSRYKPHRGPHFPSVSVIPYLCSLVSSDTASIQVLRYALTSTPDTPTHLTRFRDIDDYLRLTGSTYDHFEYRGQHVFSGAPCATTSQVCDTEWIFEKSGYIYVIRHFQKQGGPSVIDTTTREYLESIVDQIDTW